MAHTVTREWIASFTDIEAVTAHEFTPDQLVVGQNLLNKYQTEIETLLRRPLSVVVTEEPIRRGGGPGEDSLVLTRFRPVSQVSAVVPSALTHRITNGVVYLDYNLTYPIFGTAETISYRARLPEHEIAAIKSKMVDRALRVLIKEEDDTRGATSVGEAGYTANYIDEGWLDLDISGLPPKKRIIL